MNILIPMAGRGSRFAEQGYTFPKPLIDVGGRPMIQVVTDSLGLNGHYIFLVLREHLEQYAIPDLVKRMVHSSTIVPVEGVTEGAACTALLAKDLIDSDEALVIANSDQIVYWDPADFFDKMVDADGGIVTFPSTHPKWSFVRVEGQRVVEVAEKRPISRLATVGIYYFRHGSDFVRAAEEMIAAEERVNDEFYIAPTFNRLIAKGARVLAYPSRRMIGLGTPEDLAAFTRSDR